MKLTIPHHLKDFFKQTFQVFCSSHHQEINITYVNGTDSLTVKLDGVVEEKREEISKLIDNWKNDALMFTQDQRRKISKLEKDIKSLEKIKTNLENTLGDKNKEILVISEDNQHLEDELDKSTKKRESDLKSIIPMVDESFGKVLGSYDDRSGKRSKKDLTMVKSSIKLLKSKINAL